jgi:DNA polymerase-3 subunit gamma/tau
MEERSLSFEVALNDLAQLLHQIAVVQTVPDSIANDLPERHLLLDLAQRISPETLQLYYQIALLGRRDISLAPGEFAGFTMSLLRMLAFTPSEGDAKRTLTPPPIATHLSAPVVETKSAIASQTISQPTEQQASPSSEPPYNQQANASNNPQVAEPSVESSNDNSAELSFKNSAPTQFNGNWRGLLDQLKLGLARNLALNSALLSYDENTMRFAIQDKDKGLLSAMYQDKLSSALQQHFGRKIRLEFTVEGSVNTPAKEVAQEKAVAQAGAESAIDQDSFVQALINDFGASIIPNSIKPI